MTGENSILTPLQRYQESQSEFLRLQALATGPAATEETRKAQQEAISKLPTAADKFLQLSRTLFASGSQYTEDFRSVVSAVDASQATLQSQKTDAEKQIEQLQQATGSLLLIEENTQTTAELLAEFVRLQAATSEAAGLATLDRPNATIPEPVTNNAIVQQLVEANTKLAALQQEIDLLRKEQRAQTGEIILSNAQVTNANAEKVADAVGDLGNNGEWLRRSAPVIEN